MVTACRCGSFGGGEMSVCLPLVFGGESEGLGYSGMEVSCVSS